MQRLLQCACLALCLVLLGGCKNKAKEERRAHLRTLMHGTSGDAEMQKAIEKARASVPQFLKVLQNPAPNQKQFMVRKIFPVKDGKQQILWITNLTYDGTLLFQNGQQI